MSEKTFEVSPEITIICWSEKTRYGFRHLAKQIHGEIVQAKVCYYNRTWESWEFQTVIQKLGEKIGGEAGEKILAFAREDHYDRSGDRMIAMVAAMGSILAPDQTSANDWKTRMLRAGLEGRGLEIPPDWDTLTEDEKQRRLDLAIAELGK